MSFRLSLAATFGGALLALGCTTPLETFRCESNAECSSEGELGAICEPTNLCSFADPTCPDGQRYGSAAGSMSQTCVGDDDDDDDDRADSGVDQADSGGGTTIDGSVSNTADAGPIDAADSCVNITLGVIDNFAANDKVKIKVNSVEVAECQPDAVPEPNDSMKQCIECVPLGAAIELKSESAGRLSQFFSDCNLSCGLQEKCEFTATEACTAFAVFDAAMPP